MFRPSPSLSDHSQSSPLLLGLHTQRNKTARMWSYLHLVEQTSTPAPDGDKAHKVQVSREWKAGETAVMSALGPIQSIRENF